MNPVPSLATFRFGEVDHSISECLRGCNSDWISLVLMVNVLDLGVTAMTPAVWAWLAIVLAGHAICTFTTRSYIAGVFQSVVWTFAIGLEQPYIS